MHPYFFTMKYLFSLLLTAFLIISCNNNPNPSLIIGKWRGAAWHVAGIPAGRDARNVHFSFDDKGHYTYSYEDLHEAGKYKIEKDMLFTKLPRENEMMVKIVTLNTDSLVFDMSRSGTDETLFLIREKPDSTGRVP